jgi:hypothetical protein
MPATSKPVTTPRDPVAQVTQQLIFAVDDLCQNVPYSQDINPVSHSITLPGQALTPAETRAGAASHLKSFQGKVDDVSAALRRPNAFVGTSVCCIAFEEFARDE